MKTKFLLIAFLALTTVFNTSCDKDKDIIKEKEEEKLKNGYIYNDAKTNIA